MIDHGSGEGRREEGVRFVSPEEEMVREHRVREQDRVGNDRAGEAADFGRRRAEPRVIDGRRNLAGVCRR